MQLKIKELELKAKSLEVSASRAPAHQPVPRIEQAVSVGGSSGDSSFEQARGAPPLRKGVMRVKVINAEKYKTSFCAEFQRGERCSRDTRCQFSHGMLEMRQPGQSIEDYLVEHRARNPNIDFLYNLKHAD